jgi:hypothetical protein
VVYAKEDGFGCIYQLIASLLTLAMKKKSDDENHKNR